jgi:cytochrome c oxidase subunit IV
MSSTETAEAHKSPNYMAIFWWLAGLTVVEVGYSSILPHREKVLLIVGLVGFAAIKASLVALYFMHLKYERKSLGVIVTSTLILGCILVGVGMAEHLLPRP